MPRGTWRRDGVYIHLWDGPEPNGVGFKKWVGLGLRSLGLKGFGFEKVLVSKRFGFRKNVVDIPGFGLVHHTGPLRADGASHLCAKVEAA